VAFQQLYYTSCEHGVEGYAGFQFNAVSQGIGARVMQEVEQITVYELPSWDSSPADAPVNLCYVHDAAHGRAIIANVVYAGTDFSGRSGNYFAHALVAEDPERDFGGLLPVEMWQSPVWSRTATDSTVLPAIQGVPPRGSFDRPTVAAFLDAQDDARGVLARLLSAVDQALEGGRSLILWSSTSADNAQWIAAVSYLLEDARARELSFFTYTRRPAQCRAHVIGTVPGTVTSLAALAESFRVFDMTSRTLPAVTTHPLADLLTQVGVLRAAGLWRQAAALTVGTERSFDEWYPIASAAALLLGVEPLPSAAVDAIARWLPEAALRSPPLPAPHIETVLTVLLDRHRELGDDQLPPLLPTALAARAIGQLQRIEVILVNRAITKLEYGRPPYGVTPIVTTEARQLATKSCERLLGSANVAVALTVLDWARETRLTLDPQLLEQCGRQVVGPALSALGNDMRVVHVGQAYPEFARGVAEFLSAAGPDTALRLLGGVAGELLDRSDLRRYPQLREMLLLEEVRSGLLPPIQALRELIELHPPSAPPPWSNKHLMDRLWPTGLTTAGEAAELLSLLDGDLRGTAALALVDNALQPPHGIDDLNAWLDLTTQVLAHSVCAQLPSATRMRVQAHRDLGDMVYSARQLVKRGDMSWYEGLDDRIGRLPAETRDLLRQYLVHLTLAAPRPWEQLATCSGPVFDATCVQARIRLEAAPPDHSLAARVFQSFHELNGRTPRAQLLEGTVLLPTIPRWSRRDRDQIADILKRQARPSLWRTREANGRRIPRKERPKDRSQDFKVWCKRNASAGDSGIGIVPGDGSVKMRRRGRPRPGPK
jgi:GTPase-associated protein 1, N-terminal domain type 2/GTPase-associated protein 1, middle domain/GTPase-associated protein 1, C-terminal domain